MAHAKSSFLLEKINLGEELDWEPARLMVPGPWAGHIPFAHWLMKAAQPKVLVELGTHTGNSFSAFCNSIKQHKLDTRAYAVDTWQGDEHAGYYGNEIYEELREYVGGNFGPFATLIRSTFDEALSQFSPGTVDVLHIDGMHTYEAVRHDFETWADRLSARGIAIFHDTNVHERGFGVWKLWDEICEDYPSFEFKHSNGLGVLGVGQELPEAVQAFFDAGKQKGPRDQVRTAFAVRGRRFELSTELEAVQGALGEAHRAIEDAREHIQQLNADKDELETAITSLHGALGSVEATLSDTKRHNTELSKTIHDLHNSTSWRLTRPLRLASKAYSRYLRRYVHAIARRARGGVVGAAGGEPALHDVGLRDAVRSMMSSRLDAFLNSETRMRLPSSTTPDVTIILILYNQAEMTYACLAAIKECLEDSDVKIETILFDNGSSDQTHALLERVDGATIIRNPENLHFLRGVNAASQGAKGRHILLLNNDAQLTSGSLESAVRTLDNDPSIGAVGARIILPDGRLQEAGSIIWADGTCLGYGRGRKPDDDEVMFQRDVDYCSGAFLLTPRSLFERLGRLDEVYAPAYYEETDYCVRVWKENLRVVYNPKVTIHHFEFASSSKVSEALQLQQRNLETFRARHSDWLALQHQPDPSNVVLARFHAPSAPRVLFLEDRVPKPWLGAGLPRAQDIVAALSSAGAQVTIFPMLKEAENWREIWKTQPINVEVVLPLVREQDLAEFLRSRRNYYDAIFVSRPHNMADLQVVLSKEPELRGRASLIYDAEALFANREILKKELHGAPLSKQAQEKLVQDELALTKGSDLILSVTDAERKIMERNGMSNVAVLGHQVHPDLTVASFEKRKDIVFLGAIHGDNSPNADSIRWFASEVLPALRDLLKMPDLRLQVVGVVKNAPSLMELDGNMIDLLGRIDNLKSFFENTRLVVVPTRFAAGIPHKAHHVASLGVPMVATKLIAEQLGWESGRDILASSEPAQFARHCRALYTEPSLWETLRSNAVERISEECSSEAFSSTIQLVVDLANKTAAAARVQSAGSNVGTIAGGASRSQVVSATAMDTALAVPFTYRSQLDESHRAIAAVFHIFYDEVAEEILRYSHNLPAGTDIFISTDSEAKADRITSVFSAYSGGIVTVRIAPNRGRDIAPKLISFRDVYDKYELVLHLHSKKSVHNSKLGPWRGYLYETLLGTSEQVQNILEVFDRSPDVGMIFPQHFEYIRQWVSWDNNFTQCRALADRLGYQLNDGQPLDFPSGSMFWARSAALRPLLDLNLSFEDFPAEGGQEDSTLAHAVERLYAIICEISGHGWVKVARTDLLKNRAGVVRINDPQDLDDFLTTKSVRLTAISKVSAISGEMADA
ncbi:rhamnan synthesis F family protein [Aquamicrobium zhengzhouense]|uniref:Class I SAM-dependent methyltransferase n=1 Tax=Aquamicrobium zhengzhouense TaxID=2781738 RepID=A0ABS0SBK1_9HYPH|nr:rhamnan synthesis F family protein [Aquamicrobium zhengzhouense]MBI1620684.1 class I SAM-dependent methyltransferase [Aquamicrobium zhengzhouense]